MARHALLPVLARVARRCPPGVGAALSRLGPDEQRALVAQLAALGAVLTQEGARQLARERQAAERQLALADQVIRAQAAELDRLRQLRAALLQAPPPDWAALQAFAQATVQADLAPPALCRAAADASAPTPPA